MPYAASTALFSVLSLLFASQLACSQQAIRISPNNNDAGKFVGQDFNRVCGLTINVNGVYFEWFRDSTLIHSGTGSRLGLEIASLTVNDAGEYYCRATLSDGTVLGPTSAGSLQVFETTHIEAPPHQFVVYGNDASLNCSFNLPNVNSYTTVEKDGEIVSSKLITNADLSDEGTYICDVFLVTTQASIQIEFTVHVIVEVDITSHPPGLTNIEGNPPVSLSVNFTGRVEQNISVTWYRDGDLLPSDLQRHVATTYDGFELTGKTCLDVPSVQRKDAGVFRVVIQSGLGSGVLPQELLYEEISFQVNVFVPPSMPGNFIVEESSITSVFARIRWTITNQTQDAGAETLTLLLTYKNMSLVQQIDLPGYTTQVALDLIPGTDYTVRLRAQNPSGMVITDPVNFKTLTGSPKVNELSVSQTGDEDNFQVSASLAYTGGGVIDFFEVSYRLTTTSGFIKINNVPATSSGDSLVWTGTFSISDPNFDPASIQFLVFIVNEFNYKSNGSIISRSTSTPSPAPNTSAPGSGDDALPPFWLFIIVAVLGTALVMIVVVAACVLIVRCCKKGRENNKYNVNKENPIPTDVEAGPGGNRYEMAEPNNNIMLHRSEPQTLNYKNVLHNGSIPSLKTNSSSPTPQPDDQLLKKYPYIHHQKYPSDASSAFKSGTGSSTTASSSPAPAQMKEAYERRVHMENPMMRENGRGSFSTSISEGISNYGQASSEIMEIQNSQTESDVHTHQNDHPTVSYIQPMHVHQGSQTSSGMIPISRVGTSISNISVPSSIQSSHQSLINGSGIFPYHGATNPLVYTTHAVPGSGRAESICSYNTVGNGSISERGSLHPSIVDSQLQTTV